MRIRSPLPLIALLATAWLPAAVLAASADAITVVDPYVRLTPPGQTTSAAFLVLKNGGSADVRLVRAESPAAKTVELHSHKHEDGVMKMRPVKEIEVKAQGEAALQPGGYHVMLIGINKPLKEGDKVPLTLGFEDGSKKQVEAPVRRITAAPAAPMGDMHQHHGQH